VDPKEAVSQDWSAKYRHFRAENPAETAGVHHFVIIPNYKEDEAIFCGSSIIKLLPKYKVHTKCIAVHRIRFQIDLCRPHILAAKGVQIWLRMHNGYN